MTTQLLITTIRRDGILSLAEKTLPEIPGVTYLVSWQLHDNEPLPAELDARPDVTVIRCETVGSSANRNNLLEHATADILIFLDDDATPLPEGVIAAVKEFAAHPEQDMIAFVADGVKRDNPAIPVDITHTYPKGYYINTNGLALRRATAGKLRFCEEVGIATRYACGEEALYHLASRHNGYRSMYSPIVVCTHPAETTCSGSNSTPGVLRGHGVTIALLYPRTGILRVVLKAWRLAGKRKYLALRNLFPLLQGFFEAGGIRKRNKSSLW